MVEALFGDLAVFASLANGVRVVAADLPFATGLAGLRFSIATTIHVLLGVGFGLGLNVGIRGREGERERALAI